MKHRLLCLLLAAALALGLAGCSRAVGGKYKLEYITADGVRMTPGTFGMVISFELDEDGVGTAVYGPDVLDITWDLDGGEVVLTGENGELRLTRDGSGLVLHSEGTMLFFTPVED